jgi:serine phosphatase RsbU (regulator of sigma subunit)
MAILKPKSYLSLPIIAKTYARCHAFHKCNLKKCPAYENPNPHCWSVPGSGQRNKGQDEDQKRRNCVNCRFFKGSHILWMDKPSTDILVTSDEITLLTTLTNQAGIIADNFQTYENLEKANTELTKVKRDLKLVQTKINRELKQAQEIQQGLLPQVLPQTEYFTTAADYIPATKVGGDYYDIFEIEKDCYCILVADVSGHDIAAALIMSMAKILIKSHANPYSAKKTIDRINAILNSDIKNENFITMFYAIIDFNKGKMIYSSAGHNPVILIDRETKDVTPIKAEGIFLGVFDDAMVKDNEALLKKNSRLILYTDGLIEAENMTGEMYSYEKLIEIIKKTVKLHTNEVKSEIMKDLNKHIGKAPIEDDITLMILDFN